MPLRRIAFVTTAAISSVALGIGMDVAAQRNNNEAAVQVDSGKVGGAALRLASDTQTPPPPPDHCTDFPNMMKGTAHPVNQEWFNTRDAREFARVVQACYYHQGGDQFECLDGLWGGRESGWNHHAINDAEGNNDRNRNRSLDPGEGISDTERDAYGVAQRFPGGVIGRYAPDWRDNPRTQVLEGLHHIMVENPEYADTPCEALAFHKKHGYYP
jgi:hypothetical protein